MPPKGRFLTDLSDAAGWQSFHQREKWLCHYHGKYQVIIYVLAAPDCKGRIISESFLFAHCSLLKAFPLLFTRSIAVFIPQNPGLYFNYSISILTRSACRFPAKVFIFASKNYYHFHFLLIPLYVVLLIEKKSNDTVQTFTNFRLSYQFWQGCYTRV